MPRVSRVLFKKAKCVGALLWLLTLLPLAAHAAATSTEASLTNAQQKFVDAYRGSKTLRGLLAKLPSRSGTVEAYFAKYMGKELDQPLPALSFDKEKRIFRFGKHTELKIKDIATGAMTLNGRDFKWDPQANFFSNFQVMANAVGAGEEKSAFFSLVMPQANAQNRDFFPDVDPGVQAQALEEKEPLGDDLSTLQLFGFGLLTKNAYLRTLATRVALPATVATGAYTLVNYAHAYVAPSCEDQVSELKRIMNQNNIGLSRFSCRSLSGKSDRIAFWTPDKKRLPFVADWSTSELWVDSSERYLFDRTKLTSVEIRKNGSEKRYTEGSKEFADYKKNLEPYRAVLYVMGTYNSCYKCEAAFQAELVKKEAGPYTDATAAPQSGNSQPTTSAPAAQ